MLFDALDLAATFVFAISGATQGVRKRLDLFGVLVVAWAAGVAGGIARDLLIGAVPPAAIATGATSPSPLPPGWSASLPPHGSPD